MKHDIFCNFTMARRHESTSDSGS